MEIDKEKKVFSFVLVPPGGKKSISVRLESWVFKLVLSTCLVGFVLFGIGAYMLFSNSAEHVDYKNLKAHIETQQTRYSQLYNQINQLQSQMEALTEREEEIKIILGDTSARKRQYSRSRRRSKKKTELEAIKLDEIDPEQHETVLQTHITMLHKKIEETKKSISNLLDKAQQYKARFASTPSIAPLFGRIHSRYGWRYHPIKGGRRFHKGVDISAWVGAPIQATADGLVEYAGWSGSFGYLVVIDHSFGYRTIYAHCSQLLVKKGELVKKGQVISQVGTTGISTGPHLHYEIRKWNNSVNPAPYLDLDMYTATTRIW